MSRIFVGNLPSDIRESELDDLFYKYGRIRDIDIKQPARPPAFAFITYEHSSDAEAAVRGRDNYNYEGYRLRCEFARADRGGRDRDYRDDRRGRGGGRRTDYGIVITNLPKRCSWQDLKDFMRKVGDVVYADVDKHRGEGVVDFSNQEDMERAIRELDDTEFKNYDDSSYIRVKAARKRDRSRSRSADRSDHRDKDRGRRNRDRSRSAERERSRSRERKRSPSRSPSPVSSPKNGRRDSPDREKEEEEEDNRGNERNENTSD